MGLCCIFNYAPLYRASIYSKIDEKFDTQFFFGKEVEDSVPSGIEKLDYGIFHKSPVEFINVTHGGKFPWYKGIQRLPYRKDYSAFLVTGEFNWAYFPFLLSCRIMRKKVYGWGHGLKNLRRYAFLKRLLYKLMSGYFIYGEKGLDRIVSLGFPKGKFHVIYNSLGGKIENPGEYLKKCAETLTLSVYKEKFHNEDPVIVFPGRLTENKRLDKLIEAVAEINSEGRGCNLVLIGDGSQKESLEELVAICGIENRVWFYGRTYDESILSYLLYNADLCVSPGNVGLTALHCMLYGVPVLSHDDFDRQMPEYEMIEENITGMLYKFGDYSDMKDRILEWLGSSRGREQVRKSCIDVVNSHWNSDYQIGLLEKVLGHEIG